MRERRERVARAIYENYAAIDLPDFPDANRALRDQFYGYADAAMAAYEEYTVFECSECGGMGTVVGKYDDDDAAMQDAEPTEAERLTRLARIVLSTSDYLLSVSDSLAWSDLAGPNVIPLRLAMEAAWADLSDDDRAFLTCVRLESEQKEITE